MAGEIEIAEDIISASLVDRYTATVGGAAQGDNAPLGLHWCLGLPKTPTEDLGIDGHPAKGGFMPAIDLPRRMWASSEVEFLSPLRIGDKIRRQSRVGNVVNKTGSSGDLVFVTVEHETLARDTICVKEKQTIVYRQPASDTPKLPADTGYDGGDFGASEHVMPSAQLLFRYSALTFNTHRIHYDLDYAMKEEGYPALVVHGPLMASVLLRFASQQIGTEKIKRFSFQGRSPAYCGQSLHLGLKLGEGARHDLSIHGADGRLVMSASVGS